MKNYLWLFLLGFPLQLFSWGFAGHRYITEQAIHSLSTELHEFYISHGYTIIEGSVKPDIRKNTDPNEFCRHYIDYEYFDCELNEINWDSCLMEFECFSQGILPRTIESNFYKLVGAFSRKDTSSILYYSAELAHYASDLCVPLHTTENYDGQLTGQKGIHSLWESLLFEKHRSEYNCFGVKSNRFISINEQINSYFLESRSELEVLLSEHKSLMNSSANVFGYYKRNGKIIEGYSSEFQEAYYNKVAPQIENRLRASIQFVSDLWHTAWQMGSTQKSRIIKSDSIVDSEKIIVRAHE